MKSKLKILPPIVLTLALVSFMAAKKTPVAWMECEERTEREAVEVVW